jgi:hypothetical protein
LLTAPASSQLMISKDRSNPENKMRTHRFSLTALAAAFVIAGSLAAAPLLAQQPKAPAQQPAPKGPAQPPGPAPQPPAQAAPAPPKPYKPVAIKLPQPVNDPSFVAFRKQLGDAAQKKDRAGLGRLVSQSFFLIAGEKDAADKKKPGIENLAKALGLDGKDAEGWMTLAEYAQEPTAEPDPDHKGVLCAPADPAFDEHAAEQLAKDTQTDPGDWGYPVKDGVEVHGAARANSPVIDKLGLHLVRVYPEDSPASAVQGPDFVRIVLPSGKVGYVAGDQLLPLGNEQMCYVKEGNAWKIAGFISNQ